LKWVRVTRKASATIQYNEATGQYQMQQSYPGTHPNTGKLVSSDFGLWIDSDLGCFIKEYNIP